jgi:hypothetical protein
VIGTGGAPGAIGQIVIGSAAIGAFALRQIVVRSRRWGLREILIRSVWHVASFGVVTVAFPMPTSPTNPRPIEATCPACQAVWYTTDDPDPPAPGDVTLCNNCSTVSVHQGGIFWRPLTPDEFTALPAADRDGLTEDAVSRAEQFDTEPTLVLRRYSQTERPRG